VYDEILTNFPHQKRSTIENFYYLVNLT